LNHPVLASELLEKKGAIRLGEKIKNRLVVPSKGSGGEKRMEREGGRELLESGGLLGGLSTNKKNL